MKFKPKYLRIDNSGENLKLKNYLINNIDCHSIRNINIEFTSLGKKNCILLQNMILHMQKLGGIPLYPILKLQRI